MACTIRTLRESDIPALARHANNPKVAAMLRNSFPSPYTEDDARFFICELAPSLAHGEGLVPTVFGIEVDGECAGVVSLDVGSDIHARSAELGIWVGEAHWRKGVAQEAVRQALSWAFDDDPDTGLGLLRVYAEAYAFNEPSQRLLRKVGFQQEAVLRCHHRKGELGDVVLFSITKPGGPVGGELIDARSASSADADAAAAAAAAGGAEDASGAGAGADCDTSPPSRPELTAKREAASLPSALWAARADLADDFRVTGARVSLRRYRADDADNVALYANNDKIARWLRDLFPHPYTIEEAREWAGEIAPAWKREADGAPFVFAVADVSDDSLIGSISLTPGVDVHAGSAELGYWLAEPRWGGGLMSEAVALMVTYGFTTLGLDRIWATPFALNPPSRALLEKVGFQLEGLMHAYAVKRGRVHDAVMYAMTKADWEAAVARGS